MATKKKKQVDVFTGDAGEKDQATSANVSAEKGTFSTFVSHLFRFLTTDPEPVLTCSKCNEALKLKRSQLDNPDAIATIRCRK